MSKGHIQVAPSILAADFGSLSKECQRAKEAGADALHIDIMDGHFVPNLSMGEAGLRAIRASTDLFLDVHLMVYNPFDYVESFIRAGADGITFHFEATEAVEDTLNYIKKAGKRAGLAFCPKTSESMVLRYLPLCDMALLMTVEPGFGGQKFLPSVLKKIEFVKGHAERLKVGTKEKPFLIEVDGGINRETAKECVKAGANILVSGSSLFQAEDMGEEIKAFKGEI